MTIEEGMLDGIKKSKVFHKKEYSQALNILKDVLNRKGKTKPLYYAAQVARSFPHVDPKELIKMIQEGKVTVHFKKDGFEDKETYKSEDEARKSIKILKDEGFKITKVIGSKKLEEEDMTQQNPMQGKIDNLLRSGFVDKTEVAVARRAIQKLNSDETLTPDERSLIQRVFKKLLDIVTKKDSIFGSVRKSLSVQEEEEDLNELSTKTYSSYIKKKGETLTGANGETKGINRALSGINRNTNKQAGENKELKIRNQALKNQRNMDKDKSVKEESDDDHDEWAAKAAHSEGHRHGSEGVGNNMDKAKKEWGKHFKHYNSGFLKGRNAKAKMLKARGQGYGKPKSQNEETEVQESFKVGDSVHVGHAVKGGAGYKGKVKKLEGDYVFVEPHDAHKEKFGGRLIRGHIKNTTMDESFDLEEEKKITHIIHKDDLQKHKEWMDSEGYNTKTTPLPQKHPNHKTHLGIISTDHTEHQYHTDGHAKPIKNIHEGRPSQRHALDGHDYHKKPDHHLRHIMKDAGEAAKNAQGMGDSKGEGKYRDQVNDAATVLHFRKQNGMPSWYRKKYGHDGVKEELVKEVAKWRTHQDAHDYDTDGSYIPKGGIKSDPLEIRQGASKTQSQKDPKSMAGKFGAKYAKKHGVPTKLLMKNIPLKNEELDLSDATPDELTEGLMDIANSVKE